MRKAEFTEGADLDPKIRAERIAATAQKDREHHRLVAANYDRSVTDQYAIYHRWDLESWITNAAERHPGGHAVDIGAGTGVVSAALLRAGFSVAAIDHSPEMLAVARERIGSREGFTSHVGDALELPFADASAEA